MIWLKRISIAVIAMLIFLVIVLATLLYTPAGVKVAAWGAQKALPALTISGVQGALFRGFQLENVRYQDQGIDLQADRLHLDLDDRCLLTPEVCVRELAISGVQFSMPRLPESSSDEAPVEEGATTASITLPLPISIDRVLLDDIDLDILGNKVRWQHFSTAAELVGSLVTLKPTDWQDIELTLAKTETSPEQTPKAVEPADKTDEAIALPEVLLPLDFDVQRFTVKNFTLKGETPQVVNQLELVASAQGHDVNVSKLFLDVPQAVLNASTHVSLLDDYPLTLDAVVDIAMAPLSGHQLALKADGSIGKLALNAKLKGTIDAVLAGKLSPLDPKLPFDLSLKSHHIQWPIDSKAEFEVADTSLKAKGSLDGFNFDLKSAIDGEPMPAVAVDLKGSGDLEKVSLSSLKVNTLGGVITGKAKANWKKNVAWQGQLAFADIQPDKQWSEVPGKLSGQLQTSGGLTTKGGWFVKLPVLSVDGNVMSQDFSLKGQLDAKDIAGNGNIELVTNGLSLNHGPNGLVAKGSLAKNWDMTARINAPNLAQSIPDVRGSVIGNVALSGKMLEPDIQLDLKGQALGWQELASLQAFNLTGRVSPLPQLNADIALTAQNGQYEETKLKDLSLTFTGTEKQHELVVDIDAEPASAQLRLTGALDRKLGWQGVLQQAEFGTPVGPWRLNQPTALGYNLKTELATVAAHCWQQNSAGLCLVEPLEAGKSGHAKLALKRFDFDIIKPFLPPELIVKGEVGANVEAVWAPESAPYVKAAVVMPAGSLSQQVDETKPPLNVGWDKVTVNAEMKNDVLNADWLIGVKDNGDVSGQARVTQLTAEQQIDAKVKIDRFMLDFLHPLLNDFRDFGGQVDADIHLTGAALHPAVNGGLSVSKVKLSGKTAPIDVKQADLTATFSGFGAAINGNVITPDGKLLLRGKADWTELDNWRTELNVNGDELALSVPPMLAMKVSPHLKIAASPKQAEISGNIGIPWGRIKVDQLPQSAVAVSDDEVLLNDQLEPIEKEKPIPFSIKTNVLVKIGNDVKISAFGLKANLKGDLNVRQKDNEPLVYGEVNIKDGTYRSFGQELVIRKGQILFNGPADQPYLSMEAIRDPENIEDSVVAGIRVTGPADEPKIDIFSDPAMPQQNALSYILRGKDIDSESGDNSSAMTTALISMGLAQSSQLVGDVGKAFGVQDLAVDTAGSGDDSQVTISGYIAPGLQVKYGVGIFNSLGEFTVRYRLMTDLYIEAISGLHNAVDLLYQFEFD
ncbi:translocation/assembly module TamB [Photobacterium swingsii]|uniref:autotransporter assembly complex protein TamB n=1 Tax=Photobacterium swingsii TaxID=680026 RepID=UPI003D0F90C4